MQVEDILAAYGSQNTTVCAIVNTGQYAGSEVVQFSCYFISMLKGRLKMRKSLAGFERCFSSDETAWLYLGCDAVAWFGIEERNGAIVQLEDGEWFNVELSRSKLA